MFYEMFEDTKGVSRICNSKDRQCIGQMEKDRKDPQNPTQKTKDWATWTLLKTTVNSWMISTPCCTGE